jgi:hypothetical protein
MNKWIEMFLSAAFLLSSCGSQHDFSKAQSLEKKREYYQAWEMYQEMAASHPSDPKAPEALFRAGWISQAQFRDCTASSAFYDQVVVRYPQSEPWAKAAALMRNNCPNYFPLVEGSEWVEVDSETLGKNARVEIVAKPLTGKKGGLPSETACFIRTFYAGAKKFQTTEFCYIKNTSELLEFKRDSNALTKTILKWPLEPGAKWATKSGGQLFHYEVVGLDQEISVAAGTFQNCLNVRYMIEGVLGAKNEYFAPGVGRVLTTSSSRQGENRITELKSYRVPDVFEFDSIDKTQ